MRGDADSFPRPMTSGRDIMRAPSDRIAGAYEALPIHSSSASTGLLPRRS